MIIGYFFPFLADSIFIATYFSFFNFGRAWISEYPMQRWTYLKSNKDTKRFPTRSFWTLQLVQAHVEFCRQQNIHMLHIDICIQPLNFGGAYNMWQSIFVDISSGIRLLSWFSMDMTHYLHASILHRQYCVLFREAGTVESDPEVVEIGNTISVLYCCLLPMLSGLIICGYCWNLVTETRT